MNDDRPLVVIQASCVDTSLRGAAIADLLGRPALDLQIQRLRPVVTQAGATMVVTTTDLAADDDVVDLASAQGVPVVRAAQGDLLDALAIALVRHGASEVLRIPGGCPLADPFVALAALELHRAAGADHTSNLLPRSYPQGLDVEVFSARSLRMAKLEATSAADLRVPGRYLVRRPERFRLASLHSGHDLADERWHLDSAADLAHLRALLAQVPDPATASWNRILAVVGRSAKPRPDQVVLRPDPPPEPGSSPWVRTWQVWVNGAKRGEATVTAGDGKVHRDVLVDDRWLEPAREAVYRLLLEDPQTQT